MGSSPDSPITPNTPNTWRAVAPVATAGQVPAPWEVAALPWLRRFVGLRFIGLIVIVGLQLVAADQGSLDSPSTLFLVVLVYAVFNLILLVASKRMDGVRPRLVCALLDLSLAADGLLILALADLSGATGGPLTIFLLLPLTGAAMAATERRALVLTGLLSGALLASLAFAPHAAQAAQVVEPAAVSVLARQTVSRGATAGGVLILLWSMALALLWYRRRGRFLEGRLSLLEEERSLLAGEVFPRAAGSLPVALPALVRNGGSAVESVAGALAADLREQTGVVRARVENVRYQLRERREFKSLVPDLDRVLRAADRLDDARLTLAALAHLDSAPVASAQVAEVAAEVRRALTREYERDGLRLRIEASSRLPVVWASHNEVRLVLVRLLDLARRSALASGRASRIMARFLSDDQGVVLIVDDPFPVPGEPERWFDPSFSPKERPALGLALAVARAVTDRRGGQVTAELRPKGGLSVRVLFQVDAVDQRQAAAKLLDSKRTSPSRSRNPGH